MIHKVGKIIALFISLEGSKNKLHKASITLDQKGILNDKFYNKNIDRSVLITSIQSYALAEDKNIDIPYGSLGENLLMDYNPYHLKAGARLHIGEVILEVSQNCTICDHLSSIDKTLPTLLKNDRGIFAKVIKEGEIKTNDEIYILDED